MRRLLPVLLLIALLDAGVRPARADEAPRLRKWHVGVATSATWRDNFDVFDAPGLPPGPVARRGDGAGFQVGRRFGDRFVLGLQLAGSGHDVEGGSDLSFYDAEALVTGTVLFRERDRWQPFLRGGVGVGGVLAELPADAGNIFSYGTTAVAGGGCQVRLGGRVSLEVEAVATFTNFIEVRNEGSDPRWTDESWQVRTGDQGWRVGAGLLFWF